MSASLNVAVLVGTIAGVYPAVRASRLTPTEAAGGQEIGVMSLPVAVLAGFLAPWLAWLIPPVRGDRQRGAALHSLRRADARRRRRAASRPRRRGVTQAQSG